MRHHSFHSLHCPTIAAPLPLHCPLHAARRVRGRRQVCDREFEQVCRERNQSQKKMRRRAGRAGQERQRETAGARERESARAEGGGTMRLHSFHSLHCPAIARPLPLHCPSMPLHVAPCRSMPFHCRFIASPFLPPRGREGKRGRGREGDGRREQERAREE
jgi:hypothetical protein